MTDSPEQQQEAQDAAQAAADQWTEAASHKYGLYGIRVDGPCSVDNVEYVNEVLPLAFLAGASWQSRRAPEAPTFYFAAMMTTPLPAFAGKSALEYLRTDDEAIDYVGATLQRMYGAAAHSPPADHLKVIREWKLRWAASDDGGYRLAASYVDSNMMHDLAQALAERTAPPAAAVARLVEAARWACGLDAHHGCTCALCKALSDLEKQGGGNG